MKKSPSMRALTMWLVLVTLTGVIGAAVSGTANLDIIRIYSDAGFTSDLDNGDPIDRNANVASSSPAVATDSFGRTYVAYVQSDGANNHIYLTRESKGSIEIWDEGTSNFVTTMANGDPIDSTTTARIASTPAIAIDSRDNVYITYKQLDTTGNVHMMLSRFNVSYDDIQIWENQNRKWETTLTNADDDLDGIDLNTSNVDASGTPVIAIATNDYVYIAYAQERADTLENHIRMSRLNEDTDAVQIWDEGGNAWTNTLTDGDPIDNSRAAAGAVAANPAMAITSGGVVYVTYLQGDTTGNLHHQVSRWNPSVGLVQIWNGDAVAWSGTLTDGDDDTDGIDVGTTAVVSSGTCALTVTTNDTVYIAYEQQLTAGTQVHIRMSRINSRNEKVAGLTDEVQIWDENTNVFFQTFANADPVDSSTAARVAAAPAITTSNVSGVSQYVYVTYRQNDTTGNSHTMLSRFNFSNGLIEIWNGDAGAWSGTLTDADDDSDGIDLHATAKVASANPDIEATANGDVYVVTTQQQIAGANNHIYMSRVTSDGTTVQSWDRDTGIFSHISLINGAGDPIDVPGYISSAPAMTASHVDQIPVVAFVQSNAAATNRIYLSKFGNFSDAVLGRRRSSDSGVCLISYKRSQQLRR